ncbi:MAG: natural product biosynthesis luciferase-like monooxygenase protein [Oceanicoccus sp.]|jgi:natural product biosynthesis luciferase-like monooxygenase protein
MTSEADKGEILKQKIFDVADEETSFTVNAKCYQAGLESFQELAHELADDSVIRTSQDFGQFTYFGLSHRPDAAATIDFSQSAQAISQLIRALDFGPYRNPINAAKIIVGDNIILVGAVEDAVSSVVSPGEIIALENDALTVSVADGALKFSEITDVYGTALDVKTFFASRGLSAGRPLLGLSLEQKQAINAQLQSCCRYEPYWLKKLSRFAAVEIPFVNSLAAGAALTSTASSCQEFSLPAGLPLSRDDLAAAFILLLGRLGLKQNVGVKLQANISDEIPPNYFAPVLPFSVAIDNDVDFDNFSAAVAIERQQLYERGSYSLDLGARSPELGWSVVNAAIQLNYVDVLHDQTVSLAAGEMHVQFSPAANALVIASGASIDASSISRLISAYEVLISEIAKDRSLAVASYSVVADAERTTIGEWNNTALVLDEDKLCIHQLFERQALLTPDLEACVFEDVKLSYAQLNHRANQLAHYFLQRGVSSESRIGILLNRSADMVVALMATLKAGCCYVPLDPVYPADRIQYMIDDAGLFSVLLNREHGSLVASADCEKILLEDVRGSLDGLAISNPDVTVAGHNLAYVIYTSGSTGKPKGVMVEHHNVVNFFAGMDERIDPAPGVWLAVTSISFDISVLEIFWTLCRGFTVILYADERRQKTPGNFVSQHPEKNLDFNLFFWNVAEDEEEYDDNIYRLLIESAKFADTNGFNAVWTPERHFDAFGGIFPNPSITSAALATITENVELRAGSCVAPLHSPIRIAEEWAMVDNLSNGRVAIAFASGWAPPDFAIMPDNFANAKGIMFETAETVRQLWRGETLAFPGPKGDDVKVRTLPRPVQKDLPLWITTAGNVDSFTKAAEIGANLLTHLLGQTLEEVAEKIQAYRSAWKAAGHAGEGKVTLMLHTFVGDDLDSVENVVREPMKRYLKSAMFLVKSAAWQFPTFKKMSTEQGKTLDEFFENISDEDMDALLDFSFQRYYHTSGLFGTVESCMEMVDKVKGADIDEIACLIDYGIDTESVLAQLPKLAELLAASKAVMAISTPASDYSIPDLFEQHDITHFQCTPSMATMLANDKRSRTGLAKLKQIMVGGEAFPPGLAAELLSLAEGRVGNMYGPTETTIWSSNAEVCAADTKKSVSIGKPLVNQRAYILDEQQQLLPIGIAGELVIGGQGVVRGYHNREDLTADSFLVDTVNPHGGGRMYRTGDLARWRSDGTLECLGRIDHQVKIRGYRVELGEIEALLRNHADVREAAVVLREDTPGDQRLVAYIRHPDGMGNMNAELLKETLHQELPEFMVPSIFVEMSVLPLTPNGKIERNALPKPALQIAAGGEGYAPPNNDGEQMIAEIWGRALGISKVGTGDNFFDIGGHSLLVVQVLKELQEKTDKPMQMTDLFRYTTVASLAKFISGEDADNSAKEVGQARAARRKASMGRRRRR